MMSVFTLHRINSLLAAFPKLSIALVGDLFLDRYLDLAPGEHELSIETGLEAYQVFRVRNSPGALGTVINNLVALSVGRIMPVSVIGDDGHGYDLLTELKNRGIDISRIIQDPNRLTPTYTKPMKPLDDGNWVELNRIDVRTRQPMSSEVQLALEAHTREAFAACDGLIVLDQITEPDAGVINCRTRRVLAELSRKCPEKLIFIDSRAAIGEFQFGTLKPNRAECLAAARAANQRAAVQRAAGLIPAVNDDVTAAATLLASRTNRPVFCTLSENGILVARPDGTSQLAPAYPVTGPIDVVGAGDSATAAIVTSLLSGATEIEAAEIANLAASITIQQLGATGTASPQQILARFRDK
jgi:rfaE bifunctional protein kinase chain/domain